MRKPQGRGTRLPGEAVTGLAQGILLLLGALTRFSGVLLRRLHVYSYVDWPGFLVLALSDVGILAMPASQNVFGDHPSSSVVERI